MNEFVLNINYLPHDEVFFYLNRTQALLLLINQTKNSKSVLTGKLFEYLNSGRPILCIGPVDGDAATIINETSSGLISDCNNLNLLKENIENFYSLFKKGLLITNTKNLEKYTRNNLTMEISKLLDEFI